MQPQNATIAEGFTGLQRNVGAHALPPTASPDCSDVGLQGTQAILTTRRCRQRANLFANDLLGAFHGVFPEGTYLYTGQTDGGVYYDVIPTVDASAPPSNGHRVVVCYGPRWRVTQTGPGTTNGSEIVFPTSYDLSLFGLLAFDRRPGYTTEDEHIITPTVTDATVILQLKISGVWTNWITSTFNSATGWSQEAAIIPLTGTVTAGRTQTTIAAGAGSVEGVYSGGIILGYGGTISEENAA